MDPIYNKTLVAGKVVLLFPSVSNRIQANAFDAAKSAGAVGFIHSTGSPKYFLPCRDDLPCISVDYAVGTEILLYIRSTKYNHIFTYKIVINVLN